MFHDTEIIVATKRPFDEAPVCGAQPAYPHAAALYRYQGCGVGVGIFFSTPTQQPWSVSVWTFSDIQEKPDLDTM